MPDEKTLARYGYSGFHGSVGKPEKGVKLNQMEEAGYTGFGSKLGEGAPQNKALYLEDLATKSVAELKRLADLQGLEVEGTGANGRVLKADLVAALEAAG